MKYCTVCNTKYEDGTSFCALDGEVLEDDPTAIVNTTLDGQYHVESLLGKGGMGAVYRARHILLGDRVAIKILPPQMRNNAEWLRRFRREGQAARRFRHPNAVTVYDLRTTSEGMIYMVMEYVEGHTLDAELKTRGRFSPEEAFRALEPIMSVLNAAHAMGVVHRDLKPENIMIGKPADGHPVVKLLDLGIAKMREVADSNAGGSTALTVAGQILGTPYYMSPEQWGEVSLDGSSEIDGRADIYSLGTVFYELVAGRRPFCGLTLQELRREHVSVKPRPLHEITPDVPEAFSNAIARAMSKDRSDRQATAGEFAAELRESLAISSSADVSDRSIKVSNAAAQGFASQETNASGNSSSGGQSPQTVGIPEARSTQSDLSAPTVITGDSSQTSAHASPTPHKQPAPVSPPATPDAQNQSAPMATIATNPSAFSSGSSSAQPSQQQAPFSIAAAAPLPRRSKVLPVVAAALLLLLGVAALGGWYVWQSMNSGASDGIEKDASRNKNIGRDNAGGGNNEGAVLPAAPPNADAASQQVEALRYWLEVAPSSKNSQSTRSTDNVTLASGQSFKFHFISRRDCFIYIVGPGENSAPTTFLTAKPVIEYARTNALKNGEDFVFPRGDHWFTLDETPGTENYVVIVSPYALSTPSLVSAESGRALTEADKAELEQFRSGYKANQSDSDVTNTSGVDPFVSVKMPANYLTTQPLLFDIRIEHK